MFVWKNVTKSQPNKQYIFRCCFTRDPDSFLSKFIKAHGTDLGVGVRLLSGETFLQVKNSTGHRWDSNPSPCR